MKPVVICLGLALLTAASAHAADSAKSVALVRAMRSDEIAVATAKLAFLGGSMRERYGKTNNACVKRISYTDYTAGWARVVESVLSPPEIDASLVFFQSDAGVKYVEGLLRRLRSRQGDASVLPEVSGKEEITPAQLAAISDFSRSDLGQKVIGKDLTLSPAAEAMGRETTEKIAAKCGG
ncbi:MAG TPA: DUF2059 domain-containing protein [Steroidobacteraceae bacterium]|nr:DUF2059 domain-containing protein [Steroidobacteraceae bacterium]